VTEPTEATPFLSLSGKTSRRRPSLIVTREIEEQYRPTSGPSFFVSSATASEINSDNSRQTWLHREQRDVLRQQPVVCLHFASSHYLAGKSFFPCFCQINYPAVVACICMQLWQNRLLAWTNNRVGSGWIQSSPYG